MGVSLFQNDYMSLQSNLISQAAWDGTVDFGIKCNTVSNSTIAGNILIGHLAITGLLGNMRGIQSTGGGTNRIFNNEMSTCTTVSGERVQATAGDLIWGNVGHVTENAGTGSITSGATTDVITHGCNDTPVAADIQITLTENPTNTPGAIWVDTITSTQFTVNCENDPGASNLDFSWKITGPHIQV